MFNDVRMPFGQHKGERLIDVPVAYLDWWVGTDWARGSLKDHVVAHLATRADWQAMDGVKPAAEPDVDVCPRCVGDLAPTGYCPACGTYPIRKQEGARR